VIAQAQRVRNDLLNAGVEPGQSVVVKLPGAIDLVTAMFGIWQAEAVFVPVNPRQPGREIDHIVSSIRPAVFLSAEGLERLDSGGAEDPDAAFVMWTSGTTGPPKPILQTHSGYREILGRVLGSLRNKDSRHRPAPNLVPVPVSLNAGIYNVLFGLMAGAAVVLMDRFATAEFAALVGRYGIRSTVLPPAAMTMLTADESVTDLQPLRYVRSITAPLSPLAARRFQEKFGVTVLNGYGQAEIGEVIGWTAADAKTHPEKIGAVGRPHPGVEIKVIDDDGLPAGTGCPGELFVRPPRMAAGYAGGGSLADRIDSDGFVRTGDFAVVDEDGFVWIEGRATDVINRGGNKVFPDQVEEVLLLSSGVQEAAVVGAPHERLGQVPVAFVVGDATDDELEALCRQHLVPYKIPVAFNRVESLPRNEVGKIVRRQLAGEASQ
jgi:long-chain acyl-CoA synthetase